MRTPNFTEAMWCLYGLVIVHEDGCVLSVSVPENEARERFADAVAEKSVAYAHWSTPGYKRVNWYTREIS